jgi:hypothetical protein
MKFHIICEGPQDQDILEKIVSILLEFSPEFVEPSNTQTKNRGVHSILIKKRFFQFLHYSFQNRVDYIIICIDNDEKKIETGIPERYSILYTNYMEFKEKYKSSYMHNPKEFIVIPIQTIDYWILAGQMRESGPGTLRGIESIPKNGIKERVYGKENLDPNGLVFRDPFNKILLDSITKKTVHESLTNLTSYHPFYNHIQKIKNGEF